jgi:branched-chain amino acid transport system ATP-binding protein
MNTDLLSVRNLTAGYGAMSVVFGVSVDVHAGEVVAVLGRNGAGKTTSLSAIAGLRFGKSTGQVVMAGTDVSSMSPAQIIGRGLALVPEGHRVFASLSVLQNLELGAAPLPSKQRKAAIGQSIDRVFELFPVLKKFAPRPAGLLSGGQQQMIAVGQALMADPKVLMLDEPTSGIAPALCEEIYAAVSRLRSEGLGVLVVEQNVSRALRNADRYLVMDGGLFVLEGNAKDTHAFADVEAVILDVRRPGKAMSATESAPTSPG